MAGSHPSDAFLVSTPKHWDSVTVQFAVESSSVDSRPRFDIPHR
ncbi:hypothetical protein TPY_3089 [Sulfobacillus acidophilus TPY]|nr:hypothetical protein TPY_3089 [Sulfobacillus acidophilus TPY]